MHLPSPSLPRKAATCIILSIILFSTASAAEPAADKSSKDAISPEQDAARQREAAAEEDPLAEREAEKLDRPEEVIAVPEGLRFYGSVRFRNRTAGGENLWDDDGSRAGANWQSTSDAGRFWFARAEVGLNIFSEFKSWLYPSGQPAQIGDSVFTRLAYIGYESPNSLWLAGKNWSTYYQVASFTDRFGSTGADANGVYNASTDGGAAGTGRADNVLQSRFHTGSLFEQIGLKPIKVNAQIQSGNAIPEVAAEKYSWGLGLSTVIQTKKDLAVGLAYNRSRIANPGSPALAAAGIDGDSRALILGVRRISEKWYLGTTISHTSNLHTTDQGIYFDGLGWEVFGDFQLTTKVWFVTGLNYLAPDSGETQAGQFNIRYAVLGLRYNLRELERTAYMEYQFNDGRAADGTKVGHVFTVGVRWDMP
jgi:outer membrane pore protein F